MRQLIFILCAIIGVSQAQTIQYIGAPTTTVISRGNFRTDSIFYLPKRTKAPTDTAAFRYQISDSSLYIWTGSQWIKQISRFDTSSMLSPYFRKADTATLSNRINLKLNISDTSSMLTPYVRHAGYGLTKSGQSFLVDTLNIATRAWRQKGIDSVAGLSRVGGSGTTNTVAKFTASGTIGNSTIFDNGTTISTSTPIQINPTSAGSSYQQFKYSGTDVALLGTDASISGGSASDFGIYTYGANNMDLWTNNARRLRITSGGDVGIGTQSPTGTANRYVNLYGAASNELHLTNATTGTTSTDGFTILQSGNDIYQYNYEAGFLEFGTSNASRLRIFANGRVFVGASPTDAGYQFDVNGTLRSVNGANFATTSGSVGIGTASPDSKLHVAAGNIRLGAALDNTKYSIGKATAGGEVFRNAIDFLSTTTDDLLQFRTHRTGVSSDVRMTIDGIGNVGIGTVSPSGKLHVIGAAANTANIYTATSFSTFTSDGFSSDGVRGLFVSTPSVGDNLSVAYYSFGNGEYPVAMRFYSGGSEGARNSSSTPYIFRQQGAATVSALWNNGGAYFSQNVGIGTTSPAGKLTVVGANSNTYLSIDNAGSGENYYASNSFQQWQTAGSARMTLNSAGELLVNTTSDAGDYKLQVSGNTYITGNLDVSSGQNVKIGAGINTANGNGLRVDNAENSGYYSLYQNGSNGFGVTGWANSTVLENVSTGSLVLSSFNNNILFQTNGRNERMRIDAAGQVGVNVTPKTWWGSRRAIEINSGGAIAGASSGYMEVWGNSYLDGSLNYKYLNTGAAGMYQNGAAGSFVHTFYTAPSGTAGTNITFTQALSILSNGRVLVNGTTDNGDYNLQVQGNARVGTGKLDISTNTVYGLGVARTGTSEVAGQVFNSNGILYFGAESSTGGGIFSGSSAYAAVIGSGANYPLQFATNNATRATITNDGILLINTTTPVGNYKLQINGDMSASGLIYAVGTNATISAASMTNIEGLSVVSQSITGSNDKSAIFASTTWNTTGNPSALDISIVNTASGASSNYFRISDGTNEFRVTKAAEVVTAAPTGGSVRKWKLGEAATVSPTSPNRTIRIEIDGTVYYLHAKTTND